MKNSTAWAIELKTRDWTDLLGVGYFRLMPLDPCQDGMRTTVFSTRAAARKGT